MSQPHPNTSPSSSQPSLVTIPSHNTSRGSRGSLQYLHNAPANKEPCIITPPDHFAVVEPGLYRASLPKANNFPYIRSLCLKHVVILSAERPQRSVINFFEDNRIRILHTGLYAWIPDGSWKPIAEEVVKESLEILLRGDNYPILVCDVGGMHLVGMVIGCLRRLQNWNLNSVVNEYRSFAGPKTRYVNEQFIELFDIDLVTIPRDPPQWFAEQLDMECREREEYAKLVEEQRVDELGILVDTEKCPRYSYYYYSSSSPLNSETGGKEPKIRTL